MSARAWRWAGLVRVPGRCWRCQRLRLVRVLDLHRFPRRLPRGFCAPCQLIHNQALARRRASPASPFRRAITTPLYPMSERDRMVCDAMLDPAACAECGHLHYLGHGLYGPCPVCRCEGQPPSAGQAMFPVKPQGPATMPAPDRRRRV